MLLRWSFTLTLLVCIAQFSPAHAQIPPVQTMLPADCNAVVAIDVAALRETPLSVKEGWTRKMEKAYINRAIFLPPEAEQLILAAQLAPEQNFVPTWEAALMQLSQAAPMAAIAREEHAALDEIHGKSALWTQGGTAIVQLEKQVLGMLQPASRQAVSRWVDSATQNRSGQLAPYLAAALGNLGKETQIVLAIDLENSVSLGRAADWLKQSTALKSSSLNVDKVSTLLQSIKGTTIRISVSEGAFARTQINFDQAVDLSSEAARQLVLEALDDLGINVADAASHQFSVAGKSILVEGKLTTQGLRRLFSLIEMPSTSLGESSATPPPTPGSSATLNLAEPSQIYYQTVVSLLDDLRGDREKQDPRGGMDAVWMEKYARKIDRLPLLNVDEQLLDWGSKTAETLRVMSTARRDAGLTAGSQKSALRTSSYAGSYYYNGYGTVSVDNADPQAAARSNQLDRAQIDRQLQNQATGQRVEGWRLIDDATAGIRQDMTRKYHVEF